MVKLAAISFALLFVHSVIGQGNLKMNDFKESVQSQEQFTPISYSNDGFIARTTENIIILARLKQGSETAETSPKFDQSQGIFRLEGMSTGYYFEYNSIAESSLFETEQYAYIGFANTADLAYSNNAGDVALDSRNVTRYRGAVMDIDSSGRNVYDRETRYEQNMERTRKQQYYTSSKHASNLSNKRIFSNNGNFICFDAAYDNVVVITLEGQILASSEIRISKPQIWSNTGQNVYFDKTQKSFYMVCKTNYGFNWYSLDPNTGETDLVLQIKSIWPNPNWKLDNGILRYTQKLKGQSIPVEQKLN